MKTTTCVAIVTIILTLTKHEVSTLACPTLCACLAEKNEDHVKCVDAGFTEVPDGIPTNINLLDLHGNRISSLTDVFHNCTEVQILDLSFNNINELRWDDFMYMSNLRQLNLQGNQIGNLSENVFQNAPQLEILNLANNSIASIHNAIFLDLNNLYSLNLSGNIITDLQAGMFLFPENLSILDLSHNQIRELSYSIFQNLYQLQVINLKHNSIKVLDGKMFLLYNNLTKLDISENSLTTVVSNISFSGILEIDLSSNNIGEVSDMDLEQFTSLVKLTLDRNPLVTINVPVFSNLHSLQYLSLSHMPKLNYLSGSTFEGLTNLTMLNLSYNTHMSFIHKGLFGPAPHISIIDLSFNNISRLQKVTFQSNTQLSELHLTGNNLTCDCGIAWMLEEIENSSSSLVNREFLDCFMPDTHRNLPMMELDADNLSCGNVRILNHSGDSAFKIGAQALLKCEAEDSPNLEIVWITPRKRVFKYHDFHRYAILDYLPVNSSLAHLVYHNTETLGEQPSYYSISETDPNRISLLEDGSLYIDFVMRSDAGPYTCISRNPQNSSQVVINVTLDYNIVQTTYLWSLVVGFGCAASFFVLNLTYSLILAGIRRCISQRRRERITKIIESMDQYKTQRLNRIKENYHHQVGRIRDQYHFQLGRLREHHQNQMGRMGRMREGASQKVDKLKENYNGQLGRLKDYSSDQLSQIREGYNNQIDKIKDYGSDKMDRIHEKYKMKQKHVIRLLEMMHFDTCRTVFDSECIRTESMILQSDIFDTDIPIHPPIDSVSVSDSEYMTASSSESSKYNSQVNIDKTEQSDRMLVHPYLSDSENEQSDKTNNDPLRDPSDESINHNTVLAQSDVSETNQATEGQTHNVKRGSSRKHKKNKVLDPEQLSKHFNDLLQGEMGANPITNEAEWAINRDEDQLHPLLVRGHGEVAMSVDEDNTRQGHLHGRGADLSHVVDMPTVSVDNIRETVV